MYNNHEESNLQVTRNRVERQRSRYVALHKYNETKYVPGVDTAWERKQRDIGDYAGTSILSRDSAKMDNWRPLIRPAQALLSFFERPTDLASP